MTMEGSAEVYFKKDFIFQQLKEGRREGGRQAEGKEERWEGGKEGRRETGRPRSTCML